MAEALKTDTVDQQYALLEALSPLPTSSSLTPLQASITPVLLTSTRDQPGLTKAPPPPVQRILPFRPEPPRRRGTTRPWYSIPSGPGGHPIISPEPSAYQAHVVGTPSQSHAVKCEKYGEAVGHILSHFASHTPPEGLCPNCFLFHPGHACASPLNRWGEFLLPGVHTTCSACAKLHARNQACTTLAYLFE